MKARRGARGALLSILAAGLAALGGTARAADCLAPLVQNDKWSCIEELPSGDTVAYCLEVTSINGAGANRSFRIRVPFNAPRLCTCGAKGAGRKARFNAASSYFCLDATRDLAESGRIKRKKITAQLFVASENSRRAVTCRPDPACEVQK